MESTVFINLDLSLMDDMEKGLLETFLKVNPIPNIFILNNALSMDVKIGYYLFKIANNNLDAIRELALLYERGNENVKAKKWFLIGAEKGDNLCIYKTGIYYENGCGETEIDLEEAFKWYKIGANNGFTRSIFKVGYFYENGKAMESPDFDKALEYYLQAEPEMNDKRLTLKIARFYEIGKGTPVNYHQAFLRHLKFVDGPDIDRNSIFIIGCYYSDGKGVPKNEEIAFSYFLKAANLEHFTASLKVAYCYYRGRGTNISYKNAFKWYEKMATFGNNCAQFETGIMLEYGIGVLSNAQRALNFYQDAATSGNRKALNQLGIIYQDGLIDYPTTIIEPNIDKAIEYFNQGAEQKDLESILRLGQLAIQGLNNQHPYKYYFDMIEESMNIHYINKLAICYRFGMRVPKDLEEARRLFQIGADANNEYCFSRIGLIDEDLGNYEAAKERYVECINRGISFGYARIGFMYENGLLFEQNYEMASKYYEQSVALGYTSGELLLANMHENGFHYPKNPKKAFQIYKKQANENQDKACYKIGCYYDEGLIYNGEVIVPQNKKNAYFWFRRALKGNNFYAYQKIIVNNNN